MNPLPPHIAQGHKRLKWLLGLGVVPPMGMGLSLLGNYVYRAYFTQNQNFYTLDFDFAIL